MREATGAVAEVVSALAAIPADDRTIWIKVGMAVQAALGEEGREVWLTWSATAPNYRRADAVAAWRSFRSGGGIGPGTLFHLARERGWVRPERPDGAAPLPPRPPVPVDLALEERRRARDAERAARSAKAVVERATPEPHPYLAARGFPEFPGLVDRRSGALVIPMMRGGEVVAYQAIGEGGDKRFLPRGCRVRGAVHEIGRCAWRRGGRRWLVEGYATGLAVHAALRRLYRAGVDAVVVCFSAGGVGAVAAGLPPAARRMAAVIADRDASGTGERVAVETGLRYWVPPAPHGDANDLYRAANGADRLAVALRGVISGGDAVRARSTASRASTLAGGGAPAGDREGAAGDLAAAGGRPPRR